MEEELNKSDYEQLLLLINTSKIIFSLYIELAKLEIVGEKETLEYGKQIDKLKEYLLLEQKIINSINPLKLYTLIEEISKQIACMTEESDFISLISQNKIDILPLERVSKKLREHSINILSKPTHSSKELDHFQRIFASSKELMQNLENDKYILLIHIIEEKILNTTDIEQKAILIRTKYYLSYIISHIEERLLRSSFNVQKEIIFSSDITINLYNISPKVYEHQKEMLGIELYNEQIKVLLKVKNESFKEKEQEILIRETLIRTSFQFLDDEIVNSINLEFQIIKDTHDLRGYERSLEIVENSFKAYKQDKSLIKKATL